MTDKRRSTIKVDFVYDIEVESWDRFVTGGVYHRDLGFKAFWYDREEAYVDHILGLGGVGWAHNGGKFDLLHLLEHIAARGLSAELVAAGSSIVVCKVEGVELRDSARLVPLPLEKAATIGGTVKYETGLPCVCSRLPRVLPRESPSWAKRGCGGYCSIRRDMPVRLRKRLIEYMEQDCKATMRMLDALSEYAEANDLDLSSTIGSSAWKTAARTAGIPDASWGDKKIERKLYEFAREGYYGGRTQVFRRQAPYGHRYDINSAYPAALSKLSLPTGDMKHATAAEARRAYLAGRPGIFACAVRVPECFVPPLPMRAKDRIAYPTGRFDGTWTALELHYAESVGAEVQDVFECLYWSEEKPVLKAFCDHVWGLRAKAGTKTALGGWLKFYANSLTGKLGQDPMRERMWLNPPQKFRLCDGKADCMGGFRCRLIKECCPHLCHGTCGEPGPIDAAMKVWKRSYWKVPPSGHVQWAGYLTASTRTVLHRQAVSDGVGGASLCYCDTDSIYATMMREHDIGDGLGQWKYEGAFMEFTAIAPKTYAFIDPDTGEFYARAKGIPEAARSFHALMEHQKVSIDRGVLSLRSALRPNRHAEAGRLFQRKHIERGANADGIHFGDRVVDSEGLTWAADAGSLLLQQEE